MTDTQRTLIYELAKRLDLIIEVNGVCYRFIGGVICKLK